MDLVTAPFSSHSGAVSFLSQPLNICRPRSEATLSGLVEDAAHTPVAHPKIAAVKEEHRSNEMLHRCTIMGM